MACYFGFDAYDAERLTDSFVFISYKNDDWEKVSVYAKYLHDNGINVWYDNGIHEGSDWESYIMKVIAKPHCAAVLLFVSSKVEKSSVIPLEITQARKCKKPTVGIFLEGGLNLAEILNVAIDVYVHQRQSIDAFADTEENVCARILKAAKLAMEDKSGDYMQKNQCDELITNAGLFRMNYGRSKSIKDVKRAADYYREAADKYPSDHRGWVGLAECALTGQAESVEAAYEMVRSASEHYSYVVSLGCDDSASSSYTETKSRFYEQVFGLVEKEKTVCSDSQTAKELLEKLEMFEDRLGHTYPVTQNKYSQVKESVLTLYEELKNNEDIAKEEQQRLLRGQKKSKKKKAGKGILAISILLAAILAAAAVWYFYFS